MQQKQKKLLIVQLLVVFGATTLGYLTFNMVDAFVSAAASPAQTAADFGGIAIGAGLAMGLAGLGAGVGMSGGAAAAIAAITEKPETFGRAIIFVALIEGIAIFGFVIALQLIGKIV